MKQSRRTITATAVAFSWKITKQHKQQEAARSVEAHHEEHRVARLVEEEHKHNISRCWLHLLISPSSRNITASGLAAFKCHSDHKLSQPQNSLDFQLHFLSTPRSLTKTITAQPNRFHHFLCMSCQDIVKLSWVGSQNSNS